MARRINRRGRVLKTAGYYAGCKIAFMALGLLWGGCHLKYANQGGPLTHKDFTSRFTGYKVNYMLKAGLPEVENYLRVPGNLVSDSGPVKIEYLSGDNYKSLGDRATFAIHTQLGGDMLPYQLVLIHEKPGKEIWYMSEGERGKGLSILRFKLRQMNNGTKVTFTFEKEEESDPIFRSMSKAVNLNETIVKGADMSGARMQTHFDPALSPKQLLEKGERGELYEKFFQGSQSAVRIKASPDKVYEYFRGAEFKKLEKKYQFDFNRCFLSEKPDPSLTKMELEGAPYQMDLLPGLRRPKEGYYSCYLIPRSNGFIARAKMIIQPEKEGVELALIYTTEAPDMSCAEALRQQSLIVQIPKNLEQLLLQIKAGVEKQGI